MIFYILYRIGHFFALKAPLNISYRTAVFLADMHYLLSVRERLAVMKNISVVLGNPPEEKELKSIAKSVFRNFAKYLVDFFRFSMIDSDYIKRFVKIDGLSNIDEALKNGRGAIILSAHIGNWELGGYVLGKLGYSISAVVLTHRNAKINKFFINQRSMGNFKSIEIGVSLRCCYSVLKNNELLALLGDRNFSNKGLSAEFFGRPVFMPKGPSVLSVRTGAPIVCGYMVRQKDDTSSISFEKPIYPKKDMNEEAAVEDIMKQYLVSLQRCIREHPDQWYVFKDFWGKNNGKDLRPDTLI